MFEFASKENIMRIVEFIMRKVKEKKREKNEGKKEVERKSFF